MHNIALFSYFRGQTKKTKSSEKSQHNELKPELKRKKPTRM